MHTTGAIEKEWSGASESEDENSYTLMTTAVVHRVHF